MSADSRHWRAHLQRTHFWTDETEHDQLQMFIHNSILRSRDSVDLGFNSHLQQTSDLQP